MTHHAWAGVAALCFALTACNHTGEPTASTPSADSFRAEAFEFRIGEATEKVNGASVTSASSGRRRSYRWSVDCFSTRNIKAQTRGSL